MRIDSLYIASFGGLKNYRLDLSEGFNLLYGANEQGKSTLMSFIKMMFYGSERGSSLSKNLRKKYTPWDGSSMAGSIDFTLEGKKYRLEKEFRSSNSTDKTVLVDLALGERKSVPSDMGASLLGLSSAAFERSVFIGQFGFPESDTAAQSELNSKLSNIALTGDESVSFDRVFSRLQKAKLNLMSKSGKAGVYDKNMGLLEETRERLIKTEELWERLSAAKRQSDTMKAEIEELKKKSVLLKDKLSLKEDSLRAEKLREYLDTKAELDKTASSLRLADGAVIDEMYLRSLKFCLSRYTSALSALREKENQLSLIAETLSSGELSGAKATPQTEQKLSEELKTLEAAQRDNLAKLQALKADASELERAKTALIANKKKASICVIPAALFLIAATLLGILKQPLFAALCGIAGILLAGMGIAALSAAAKYKTAVCSLGDPEAKIAELEAIDIGQEIFDKKVKLEAVRTAINSNTSVIEKQKELLTAGKKEQEELFSAAEEEKQKLIAVFSRYKPWSSPEDAAATLDEIAIICNNQKDIKNRLNFIARDLGNISYAEAERRLEELARLPLDEGVDYDALRTDEELYQKAITDKSAQLASLLAEIRTAERGAENPEHIKKEIADLCRMTEDQKAFCDACDIAMQTLNDGYAKLRSGFGSALEAKAGEYFKKLSGGKYGAVSVSDSFKITVTEEGLFPAREVEYLSSGAADQAYLGLRLAIASLMKGDEALPLLLDDSLAQYDDDRLALAMEFLKEYSETCQIIMFTCHKAVAAAGQAFGAEIKPLKE